MAALHGRDLLERGYTLEQVVRDYGDVCQAVTSLAYKTGASIEVDEFRTFNRCLDKAVAGAVTEYAFRQAAVTTEDGFEALNSRLGPLAHELRNYLHIATYAVKAIKAGNVGMSGATGAVLDRSLIGMRNLIDRSLAEVRVTAGLPPRLKTVRLADFLSEVAASSSLDPLARECRFTCRLRIMTPRLMWTPRCSRRRSATCFRMRLSLRSDTVKCACMRKSLEAEF
jgi:hypothetical protein